MTEPEYDSAEAEAIFSRAHHALAPASPVHYQDKANAAQALLKAVLKAAGKAGYAVENDHGTPCVVQLRKGVVHLEVQDDTLVVQGETLAIEYDAAAKVFVGTKEDDFYNLDPGKPKRKQSAVAAVAEAITRSIAKQAKAKSGSR